MQLITVKIIRNLIKKRITDSHKGNYGHALIIAGNQNQMGAALIAAKACLRSGVGLLSVSIPKEERLILQTNLPEAMLQFRENFNYDFSPFSSIGIGPALTTDDDAFKILSNCITIYKKPMVIDADALTIISTNERMLSKLTPNSILTPHIKEFDRLFGEHTTHEERIQKAIEKAYKYKIVIVLKGYRTVITNGEKTYYNTTGNAGLAKGGSGDALTGMITSFLAQGYEPIAAAQLAVFIHGLAADITLKNQSMESMLISNVIDNLGLAFKKIT